MKKVLALLMTAVFGLASVNSFAKDATDTAVKATPTVHHKVHKATVAVKKTTAPVMQKAQKAKHHKAKAKVAAKKATAPVQKAQFRHPEDF